MSDKESEELAAKMADEVHVFNKSTKESTRIPDNQLGADGLAMRYGIEENYNGSLEEKKIGTNLFEFIGSYIEFSNELSPQKARSATAKKYGMTVATVDTILNMDVDVMLLKCFA